MLMDLQDLREAKWVSLKGDAGPKPLKKFIVMLKLKNGRRKSQE